NDVGVNDFLLWIEQRIDSKRHPLALQRQELVQNECLRQSGETLEEKRDWTVHFAHDRNLSTFGSEDDRARGDASANCSSESSRYRPPRWVSSACDPTSTMRPCSMTRIVSARRTVASRCATTKLVRPAISRSSACITSASDSASSPVVGSSRI